MHCGRISHTQPVSPLPENCNMLKKRLPSIEIVTWTQNRFSSLILNKNIAKGTTDPRVDSGYQSNFFSSYHKFSNKSLPDFIFIFSTKQQLQNLNQISAFQLNLNFKILTRRSFRISTKNNLHNLNQGSAAKYWLNFSFKISPELPLQNLDQTLCWTLDNNLILWPNFSFQICTKLSSTRI